jgi:hypothetical protein
MGRGNRLAEAEKRIFANHIQLFLRILPIFYGLELYMRSHLVRISIIAAVVALSACSGQGSVPTQAGNAFTAIDAAKDPCNIKDMWYFMGSCSQIAIKDSGSTITLKTYKGITMTESLGKVTTTGKVTIISGDGTGKADITGSLPSGLAFPFYGKSCFNASLAKTKCTGKQIVYFDIDNVSKNMVSFETTPEIAVTDSAAKGTCTLDNLKSVNGQIGYQLMPITAKVKNGKFTLKAVKDPQELATGLFVFGISCE